MKRVIELLKNFVCNVLVALIGLFIHRDKSVVLFGAWMGQRYADNSRFLYEYVATHKAELGIKHAVWVSQKQEVVDYLTDRGFEAYLMKSRQSIYWHLKSGIHIVCNMYSHTGKYNGDILGELSLGAKKIQLWHGVAIKACGNLVTRNISKNVGVYHFLKSILFSDYLFGNAIFSPGCWKNRYQITTGPENSRVAVLDYGVAENHVIEANYPRETDEIVYTPDEEDVIEHLVLLKRKYRLLLYCPTFRELSQKDSVYQNPIESAEFMSFLKRNNLIWVEKRHFASSFKFDDKDDQLIYPINSDFDINLLYKYVDLLVTDYSSAASDFVFRMKKVVSFIPDIDQYESQERGFVCDYDKYYPGEKAKTVSQLEEAILTSLKDDYLTGENLKRYETCREFLFSDNSCDNGRIWTQIVAALYK